MLVMIGIDDSYFPLSSPLLVQLQVHTIPVIVGRGILQQKMHMNMDIT